MICLGIWSLKCCHASAFRGSASPKGPRRSSRLDLPRDSISRRLSRLSLPGYLYPDLGMPGSQVATVLGKISFKMPISFFLCLFLPNMTVFQMENNQSTSRQMPLRCILDNWKLFNPLTLRKSHLKFFCATAWPQYPLGDKEHWPKDGTLNYNTILQLELFCKRQGKWTEIPYVQIFFRLRDIKELCLLSMGLLYALKVSPLGKWC